MVRGKAYGREKNMHLLAVQPLGQICFGSTAV